MSQPSASVAPGSGPAPTGYPGIDAALARLAELEQLPVAEHLDHLAQAHEVLDHALQQPRTA